VLCLAVCALGAAPAEAQMTWTDKAFVNVNVGSNSGSIDLGGDTTFSLYDETGTTSYAAEVKPRQLFDISGGMKVWRNLAIGAGFSRSSKTVSTTVTATVPDPLFFDAPRTTSTDVTGLKHSQQAVHLMAVWMVPVTDKIDVAVSAGPSFWSVKQDLPGAVAISEPGPVASVAKESFDESTVGINIGADVTYLITKMFGAGVMLRYSGASVDVGTPSQKIDVGGFQFGGGLRVRF
jgi:hypothetical protein